ncbi:MAG: ABC transporter permease [Mycobacteriaceae bacterium]|jgi:peptide/nickel transport system permease protein
MTTQASATPGRGTWAVAISRLRRNRAAMLAAVALVLIALGTLLAPVYADHVAHTDPFSSNLSGTIVVDGKQVAVIQPNDSGLGSIPIGPTLRSQYFLGADTQGRDVAARLLYGGRASLLVGIGSALIACFIATLVGLFAGFLGGATDAVVSRTLDIIWAFPIYLLAIALSTVLLTQGISLGPITVDPQSLWLPILIIGVIYVPYVARPVRGEVIAVRRRDYVEASIAQGARRRRLLFREVLPNVIPSVIVIFPLMVATCILTESALSFLSIGVQPPQASWGSLINDGQTQLYTRPWVSIAPGILITITILALNVLGDGVREAVDPRAKVRTRRLRKSR